MIGDPTFTRRLLLGGGFGAALSLPQLSLAETHRHAPRVRLAHGAPLIVLDPGHGGKDPGAIGVSGTYEKHVAFAAAGELARQLDASGQYRVTLTRQTDSFVKLSDRVRYAQAERASLFISIHADALPDHAVGGASVYTLATTASDAQSNQLAQRENAADRFAGTDEHDVSPQVAEILASLIGHETRLGAARVQRDIVTSLREDIRLLENPARHAAFAVLKAADIPSVLVEMGFMSNPRDEADLRETGHRAKVVSAIKRAVEGYFAADGRFAHGVG